MAPAAPVEAASTGAGALAAGFKSFPPSFAAEAAEAEARQRSRSRSQRARARAHLRRQSKLLEDPFFTDCRGRHEVLDGHRCVRPEAFPEEALPLAAAAAIHGLRPPRRGLRGRGRAAAAAPASPPGRRYFKRGRHGAAGEAEAVELVEQRLEPVAVGAAAAAVAAEAATSAGAAAACVFAPTRAELSGRAARPGAEFIPVPPAASRKGAPSFGEAWREARRDLLSAQCRQTPDRADRWMDFAEFQWSHLGEGSGVGPRAVLEKQRTILEAALEARPDDLGLHQAVASVEGSPAAGRDPVAVQAARRKRLLANGHAGLAEELTWSYLEAACVGGDDGTGRAASSAPPVRAVRHAAWDALGILAARKAAAGHDVPAVSAIERAQLAATSAVALAEAASGRAVRALALLQAVATLAVFFPGEEPAALGRAWQHGCRLGACGALQALQTLRLLDALQGGKGLTLAPCELPAALQTLGPLLEAAGAGGSAASEGQGGLGGLAGHLERGGGRVAAWAAAELRRTSVGDAGEPAEGVDLGDLQAHVVALRTDSARREALLRLLDALGAQQTLARHPPASRYRAALADALLAQRALLGGGRRRAPSSGLLPGHPGRAGLLARSTLQGLTAWPQDALLQGALLEALWDFGGGAAALPRRVLRASEDPRLFYAYARGLWARGDVAAARALLLKLCAAGAPGAAAPGADVRVALGWWHLELQSDPEGPMPPRAFRVLHALAMGSFGAAVLDDAPLGGDVGMKGLQAARRLPELLPRCSKTDASGCHLLLSSHHAVLVATCALSARSSPRRALELLLAEAPAVAAGGAGVPPGQPARGEEERCWSAAAGMVIELLGRSPTASPGLVREAVWAALARRPRSPWLLRALAASHLRHGSVAGLRRAMDRALGIHRPPALLPPEGSAAEALQVALLAEMACGPGHRSAERLTRLCEAAVQSSSAASPFAGTALWCLYHAALASEADAAAEPQRAERCAEHRAEHRWRVAVRAVGRNPGAKALWLLQLAAWEARAAGKAEAADEEEVLGLVEEMEAQHIALHGDVLEAIA